MGRNYQVLTDSLKELFKYSSHIEFLLPKTYRPRLDEGKDHIFKTNVTHNTMHFGEMVIFYIVRPSFLTTAMA